MQGLLAISIHDPFPKYLIGTFNGLVLLFVLFVPFERLFLLRPTRVFRRQFWADVGILFLNRAIETFCISLPFLGLAWLLGKLPLGPVQETVRAWPFWGKLLAGLVVGDIGAYWAHRLMHTYPLLWRFHKLHHAAEEMDWLVNIRVHPVEMVFMRMFQFVPLYALGFIDLHSQQGGWLMLLVPLVGALWGYFIHANVKLRFGPLEWLVTTPAFHHWHHTNDAKDLHNHNYSSILPACDLAFGSFYLPKGKRTQTFGIDEVVATDFTGMLASPFVKGPRKPKAEPPPLPDEDHPR